MTVFALDSSSTTSRRDTVPYVQGRTFSVGGASTVIPSLLMIGAVLAGGHAHSVVAPGLASVPLTRLVLLQQQREGSQVEAAAEDIIGELGRLTDGWNGEGSLAPSAAIQHDVAQVVAAIQFSSASTPELHVDDDGSTSLICESADNASILSLEFFGKGYVACTFAHRDTAKSRFAKFSVLDDVGIVGFLEDAGIDLVTA